MGASSVWHLLASTPSGCKFEAIDFKIDFIYLFMLVTGPTRLSLWLRVLLVEKSGDAQLRVRGHP
jgi:hypothetical protein